MHIEQKHTTILLTIIINHDLNLNSNSNTKTKINDQRDKKIYVEVILFDTFEFFVDEIDNLIDVENQKSEINYLNENNLMLINENGFQNKLNS